MLHTLIIYSHVMLLLSRSVINACYSCFTAVEGQHVSVRSLASAAAQIKHVNMSKLQWPRRKLVLCVRPELLKE